MIVDGLLMNERWKQVPAFQKKEEQASPRRPQNLGEIPDNGSEVKRGVETFASEARVASDYIGNAIERISFWSLFKTIIAWILCYKDTLRTRREPYISPSVLGSCPSGWIKFDQHCYLFRDTYNDRRTWTSARYMCRKQGANLLSITSKQEQDFLSHHFTDNLHGQVWLGEPYISPSVLGSCPSGWIKFDQHCYLFRDTYNDRRTWTSARYMCRKQGANLLSITSKQEQDFLSHHFTDNLHGQVWLGLNDRNIEAGHTWSDGSPVTFLNWHPGEPNDLNNVEKCAEMYPADTRWNDVMCIALNGYVCKQPLECSRALGMVDGSLRNKVNASSWISYVYHPGVAFLNFSSAWCAKNSQPNQYIQVEFLTETRLSKIATQGSILNGVDSYINTYKVQTSPDGINFATYQKNGKDLVFIANRDSHSIVTLAIKPPIDIPRFVRLVPIIWTGAICLRMELYGCPYVCETPLGMESGEVKDADISASSNNSSHGTTNARPFNYVGWCAQASDTQPWFQISFTNDESKITKITTWGGGWASGYVKVYNLQFTDGDNVTIWSNYKEGGKIRNFRGNQDAVHPLTHLLAEPIITRNLRVKPLSWSTDGVCLRLEIYGCKTGSIGTASFYGTNVRPLRRPRVRPG
ncbi:Coagulation factor VIII [Acropora cervicornis]|uniref:Coagulation factor VIII n=1 Tax=Acropora cervicornis TaxID=6130 RepID=A0AAD9PU06_ACRCE|nr:Coagulation factor VIII [Acropora cervicornis]